MKYIHQSIKGSTLAARTRQRNFLIMRLRGSIAYIRNCSSLYSTATVAAFVEETYLIIDAIKAEQKQDKADTLSGR